MKRNDAYVGQVVVRIEHDPHPEAKTRLGDRVIIAGEIDSLGFKDKDGNAHSFAFYEPASIPTSETDPAKHGGCCLPYTTKDYTEVLKKPEVLAKQEEISSRLQSQSKGRKDDSGKLDWSLLPIEPIENIIRVLMKGAEKYAPDNWKFVLGAARRYYNAAMRHLVAFQKGERIDPEWNLPHLAHAACCLLFLAWIDEKDHTLPPIDNYLA